jgi:hypothetical protein
MSSYLVNFAKHGNPNVGDAYPGPGDFASGNPSTPTKNVTMYVGDSWGDVPVASPVQIELILDFFHRTPF